MISIVSLWLPIILSAIVVFLVSSVLHMVLRYHWNDFAPMPQESSVTDAIRSAGVPPGNYMFPRPESQAEMKTPEFQERMAKGPVGFLIVTPGGFAMGKNLLFWFLYALAAGVLVACITGRTVAAGTGFATVLQVAGTAAFFIYAGAHPVASIWQGRNWSTTFKHMFDGLVYALCVGACFAALWPGE